MAQHAVLFGMYRKNTVAAVALLLTAACDSTIADPAPEYVVPATEEFPTADLALWCADTQLEQLLRERVAPRVRNATRLSVRVSQDAGDVPLFWMDRDADGWWGLMHESDGVPSFLAIGSAVPDYMRETVLLHEVLHALGGRHVVQGTGVLSPQAAEPFPLTAVDLESVCFARDCSVFQPEADSLL